MAYQNYDDYMASTGQQSTMDQQRRNFTYNAAKSAWENSNNSAYGQSYNQNYDAIKKEIEAQVAELKTQAQGDYDFISKWIEKNYADAVGNNDTARAEIIKTVASDLEKSVGRIGYDFETGKYRIEQSKETALTRLKADEVELTRSLKNEQDRAIQAQNTNLNARGLMEGGSRDTVEGLAGKNINQQDTDYADKFAALARSIDEKGQDINRSADNSLTDLYTTTRRNLADATDTKDQSSESAKRALENKLKALELQKSQDLKTGESLANLTTMRQYGF